MNRKHRSAFCVRALGLLSFSLVTSCATTSSNTSGETPNERGVRNQAAFDFNCPREQIDVQDLDGRSLSFGATGCGKRASYVWKGSTVILNSPIQSTAPDGAEQAAPSAEGEAPPE